MGRKIRLMVSRENFFLAFIKVLIGISMAVFGLLFLGLDAIRIYLFKRF